MVINRTETNIACFGMYDNLRNFKLAEQGINKRQTFIGLRIKGDYSGS